MSTGISDHESTNDSGFTIGTTGRTCTHETDHLTAIDTTLITDYTEFAVLPAAGWRPMTQVQTL